LWTTLVGAQRSPAAANECSVPAVPDESLIAYLELYQLPLAHNSRDLPVAAAAYLAASCTRLLVPLVVQRRLVGLLSLREPAAGGTYSSDDLLFLSALADQAATAVRLVQLSEELGRAHKPVAGIHNGGDASSATVQLK
jgi:GAF domain-containing protein